MANQIVVNAKSVKSKIDKNIYGHFSEHLGRCIYDGFYVGENSDIPNVNGLRLDIIEAMKKIKTPVLRWPGGCFADEYHWKDGIGPKEKRPSMINTHWGGVVEDNSFGTHEFFDLCEKIGCEPYICGNVGSGTVQEMSEWIEYMTFDGKSPMADLRRENGREKPWKLKYFGVGNENWGCGGRMRAALAFPYRRFPSGQCRSGLQTSRSEEYESPESGSHRTFFPSSSSHNGASGNHFLASGRRGAVEKPSESLCRSCRKRCMESAFRGRAQNAHAAPSSCRCAGSGQSVLCKTCFRQ